MTGPHLRRALAVVALGAPLALVAPAVRAAADPVSNAQSRVNQVSAALKAAQAQAAAMNAQLQADGARLDELAQQYEVAQQHVADLDAQIAATQSQIAATQARVQAAQDALRRLALRSYMNGSSDDSGIDSLFSSPGEQSLAQQEYSRVAGGNVSSVIDGLQVAKQSLTTQENQLQGTETQARAAAAQVASARDSAAAVQAAQSQALAGASAQVKTLLVQQQQAEQAEAAAKYQAEQAALAAAQAAQARNGSSGTTFVNVPVSQNASGAIQAAESQLGVPYVWGGESPRGSPNPGFDCSGLTQWSWRQAGVSLPRTAQEQYDAITHVAMSAIQPGDLIFWNDGTSSVQHVGMYVGNGNVIDAPQTGQTVQIQPIWYNGLVGAGRP